MTILGACEQIIAQQKLMQEFVESLSNLTVKGFDAVEAMLDAQQKQIQAIDGRLAAIEATLGTTDPVSFEMNFELDQGDKK